MNSHIVKLRGAVIYTRVSGNEQAEHGTSLESQRDACRAKALALSLPIVAEYEDAGISGGFLLARPGMQAAIADIQAGRADTLICASISRYSRDTEHQQSIRKAVRAAGGSLIFCDMHFDDTPEGDLAFGIMGNMAEYERKSIAARTEKGRRKRAEQGQQPARARAPYGYHIVGKEDVLRGTYSAELRGQYIIIEAEAEIVRAMFEQYASGTNTLSGVARWLNDQGIKTKHRGGQWALSSLHAVLSNPVYKGEASYGRHVYSRDETRIGQINPHTGRPIRTSHQQRKAEPGEYLTWPVAAIVSEEVWNAVQVKFKQNVAGRSGNPKRLRMLAGRITCPVCEGGMTVWQRGRKKKDGTPQRSQVLYQCSHYRWKLQNTGSENCDRTAYRLDVVEGAVLTALGEAATNPASVQAARAEELRRVQAERAQEQEATKVSKELDPAQEIARIEADLSTLALRQEAVVKAQIEGIMAGAEVSAYAAVFGELRDQRTALEAQREALRKQPGEKQPGASVRQARSATRAKIGGRDFSCLLADMHRVLTSENVPGDRKRDLLGTIVKQVFPAKDGAKIVFLPGVFDEGGALGEGSSEGMADTETLHPYTYQR